MQGTEVRIVRPPAPFSLPLMERRMRMAKATEFHVADDGTVLAVVGTGSDADVVRVRPRRADPDAPELELTLFHPDPRRREQTAARIARALGFHVDLEPFYRLMAQDDRTGAVVRRFRGLRPVGALDLFESVVKTIIGQQLNMAFAGVLTRRLVKLCGSEYRLGDTVLPVFPSPDAIARLRYEALQELQFSRRKAEYVIDFARLVDSGRLDLEALDRADDEEVVERLTRVRGLGRWSAECTLMFGLGRQDVLPAADIGLRNAVQRVYGLEEQPSEETVRELGERWRPYRTLATFYMWATLSAP